MRTTRVQSQQLLVRVAAFARTISCTSDVSVWWLFGGAASGARVSELACEMYLPWRAPLDECISPFPIGRMHVAMPHWTSAYPRAQVHFALAVAREGRGALGVSLLTAVTAVAASRPRVFDSLDTATAAAAAGRAAGCDWRAVRGVLQAEGPVAALLQSRAMLGFVGAVLCGAGAFLRVYGLTATVCAGQCDVMYHVSVRGCGAGVFLRVCARPVGHGMCARECQYVFPVYVRACVRVRVYACAYSRARRHSSALLVCLYSGPWECSLLVAL